MVQIPDNAELTYKCNQCGHMFTSSTMMSTGASLTCPFCKNQCKPGQCEIIGSSNEGH